MSESWPGSWRGGTDGQGREEGKRALSSTGKDLGAKRNSSRRELKRGVSVAGQVDAHPQLNGAADDVYRQRPRTAPDPTCGSLCIQRWSPFPLPVNLGVLVTVLTH